MGIGKRIKEARTNKGLTQEELAKMIGVTKGAIANYEVETSHPKEPVMYALINALDVDANFLFQDCVDIKKAPSLPDEALKVAKDYNRLDSHGKSMTRMVISEEQKRMDEEAKVAEAAATPSKIIPFAPKKKTTHKGIVTLDVYEEPVAAGTGNAIDDLPPSHEEQYPEEYVPSKTDFGVVVSGRSMEPKYPDQSVVFVMSTQVVEPGEVGIFLLDGQTFIKQLQVSKESGEAFLHSLNPGFGDIAVSSDVYFRPLGKVLGGYDPATRKVIWK